jgi:inhibitor of cysteine peptidase
MFVRRRSRMLASMLVAPLFAAAALAAPPVALTVADNGRTVPAPRGGVVTVKLASNPTTGFAWHFAKAPDPRVLKLVAHRYAPSSTSPPLGAGGFETWRFVATGKGRTTLALAYFRSWAPRSVARRFSVGIRVS